MQMQARGNATAREEGARFEDMNGDNAAINTT